MNSLTLLFSRSIAIDEPLVLTAHNGEKVDVNGIKPTKTETIFDKMDIDGVIHEHENPISSGQLSFREVLLVILTSNKSCIEKSGAHGEHGKGMRKV